MSEWTDVGAGWKKTSKNGKEFINLKFQVNGVDFKANLFPNEKKEKPNQPDFRMSMLTEEGGPSSSEPSF